MDNNTTPKEATMKATVGQIVIAWTEMDGMETTGRMVMRDRNWFPEFKAIEAPRAARWLRKGTAADVVKAEAVLAQQDKVRGAVFVLPLTDRSPLDTARARVMA